MSKARILLPSALLNSSEFRELTPGERERFEARFDYILGILDHITDWLSGSHESFKEFIDTLELDVAVSQNLPNPSNAEDRQTSYLVHSSWTFDTTAAGMQHAVPVQVSKALDKPLPPLSCSKNEFNGWLKQNAEAIELSLDSFAKAKSLSEVVAAYISLDILLGLLLVGCYKVRLNATLLQQSQ